MRAATQSAAAPRRRAPDLRPGRAVRPSDLGRLQSTQTSHVLYCPRCHGTYSADARDYSFHHSNRPFRCCGVNNYLITR